MKEIVLGTVGTGEIVRHILKSVSRTPGIRAAAVYSRSAEKGRLLVADFGIPKIYTDLDKLLADGEINTVYIASPNSLHHPQAFAALTAGKNVLLEKPFCPRKSEAEALFALARQKGLFITDAVPTLFQPNYPLLKAALPEIGRVRLVTGNYSQRSARYLKLLAGERTNVFDPAFCGGCLMDINYYNIYLAAALFGAPERVTYTPNLYHGDIDTSGTVTLVYRDFVCALTAAKDTWGVNSFQIEGEQGYIYCAGGPQALDALTIATETGTRMESLQTHTDRWLYEIQGLVPVLTPPDWQLLRRLEKVTLDTVETVERARLSAGLYR